MRKYKVELIVYGAVAIEKAISFKTEKELDFGNVFKSNISIGKHSNGFTISTTVFTVDESRAHKVALLFIGKMLDVLSLKINSALNVSVNKYQIVKEGNNVKAIIDENEFKFCFNAARVLNLEEDKLLRAFSWYRKGLYTEDPFDKFLAFWNSISVVADGYANDNKRTRLGTINKIWDCFTTLWGDNTQNWKHINGNDQWINQNNDIRNKIAHGGITVDIDYVEKVLNNLDSVQSVAYNFLIQWAERLDRGIL